MSVTDRRQRFGGIANETTEHINTSGVSDSIRTALINSAKFRFVVGPHGQLEIENQVEFQQGSGRVNPAMIRRRDAAPSFARRSWRDPSM